MEVIESRVQESHVMVLRVATDHRPKACLSSSNRTTRHFIMSQKILLNEGKLSYVVLVNHPEDWALLNFVHCRVFHISLLRRDKLSLIETRQL